MYDIRIWEEIRDRVEWKESQLSETIKKEIAFDRSLQEFKGSDPVPWQLRQIMQQRAESWIQRLYHFCCDAYKGVGKETSLEFDMAVWAYCIDPFIMREAKNLGYRASELLELLLCAVGSWPEIRSLLRVSQKDCCIAVRSQVWEVWHERLLHIPSKWHEAARAIAHHNDIERQARRMVALQPPQQPNFPPMAPMTPVTQVEMKTAARSEPDSTHESKRTTTAQRVEPTSPVAPAAEAQREIIGEERAAPPAPVSEGKWEEIEISFISDERVQIRRGKKMETLNYAEFGFDDGRTGNPNQAWLILRRLAELGGKIENRMDARLHWSKLEKRIQEIRVALREHFTISSDPIPFNDKDRRLQEKSGYRALFKICCAPSYRS